MSLSIGLPLALTLIAALLAIADLGPGDLSLDHALGIEVKGPLVALAAAAGGIGAATILTRPSAETGEQAGQAGQATAAAPAGTPADEAEAAPTGAA